MPHWNSVLIVYRDEQGQEYVTVSLPQGRVNQSEIRVFQANGPYMPLGMPEPKAVENADRWMADLTEIGFTFLLDA